MHILANACTWTRTQVSIHRLHRCWGVILSRPTLPERVYWSCSVHPLCLKHTVLIWRLPHLFRSIFNGEEIIPFQLNQALSLLCFNSNEFSHPNLPKVILTVLSFEGMEGWRVQDGGNCCNSFTIQIHHSLLSWIIEVETASQKFCPITVQVRLIKVSN